MPGDGNEVMQRAFATLQVKSFDSDARTFEGIASTPTVDVGGDIMDPFGAQFSLPMPMLWQHGKHDIKDPVGWVTEARATKDGIYVKGKFAQVDEPPSLKDQLDRAWSLVKSKLVRGLSIGWRPFEGKPAGKDGSVIWTKWGWYELSAVAIPMNTEASILAVKAAFQSTAFREAAPGRSANASQRPGAAGQSTQQTRNNIMLSIDDRLAEREGQRAEKAARVQELTQKCDNDFDKLDANELNELDTLNAEVGTLDRDIDRYRGSLRAASSAKAIPRSAGTDPDIAVRVRRGDGVMKSNLPPGTLFTRATIARVRAFKQMVSMSDAAEWAKKQWPDTPEVAQYVKANPGTGLSGNWGEPLAVVGVVENDFIAALRPATIIGRLNLRPSPFNVKRIVQNASSNAAWVGRAVAKPVGEGDYDTVQVDMSKIADIVVLTDDLIMASAIDAVEATRQDLIGGISQFADEQFTDPSVAAVANVNPASVTNNVTPVPASGTTAAALRADLYALLAKFSAANIPVSGVALVMNSAIASGLAMMSNPLGQPEFPGISVNGGSLLGGYTVVVSDNVFGDSTSSVIIAIKQSEVFLAQSGGIRVDMSRDATIDMSGGNSPTYSLFQKNSVGLRGEWWVSWKKARPEAVQYISGAAYAPV